MLFTLAWRNIWRHPRRTGLTVAAIAVATGVLVFFIGIQLKSYDAAINATIAVFSGHIQVQKVGYLERPQLENTIKNPEILRELVQKQTGIKTATMRGAAFALAASNERSFGTQVIGVLPEEEKKISSIPGVIRKGRYLKSSDTGEAVVGSLLARNLKIGIGEDLTLLGQAKDGSIAAFVIPVVGIFESGVAEIDRSMVQLGLSFFLESFGFGNEAHSLVMVVEGLSKVEKIKENIRSVIKDEAAVLTWNELLPGLKQSIELDMAAGWLFYISLIIVVTLIVLNTFLMSVLERTKEFGILMALGVKPRSVSGLVIIECVLLSLVGILFGLLLGSSLILYFWQVGFSVPGFEEVAKMWNIPAKIYPELSWPVLTLGPTVMLVAALISVIYPASKVYFLTPLKGIRQG